MIIEDAYGNYKIENILKTLSNTDIDNITLRIKNLIINDTKTDGNLFKHDFKIGEKIYKVHMHSENIDSKVQ